MLDVNKKKRRFWNRGIGSGRNRSKLESSFWNKILSLVLGMKCPVLSIGFITN